VVADSVKLYSAPTNIADHLLEDPAFHRLVALQVVSHHSLAVVVVLQRLRLTRCQSLRGHLLEAAPEEEEEEEVIKPIVPGRRNRDEAVVRGQAVMDGKGGIGDDGWVVGSLKDGKTYLACSFVRVHRFNSR
jgi:hypothetical protein